MISAWQLKAQLGAFIMDSLSLDVQTGEFMVLLGPSGAGKTVLLESMIGLKPLLHGRVTIMGKDVTDHALEDRHIAYMPQDVALFPHLSVRENVLFGRRVRKTMSSAEQDLDELVDMLHIRHLLTRKNVRSLSGGERQRVALARALITHPAVLFLDESFSALDADIRRQLLLQLRELQQRLRLTSVYVTHSLSEAQVIGDRVTVLMAGRVVQVAHPTEVFRFPADLRVARFTQLANIFPVDRFDNGLCQVFGQNIEVRRRNPNVRAPCWLGIAADDVLILHPGEAERYSVHTNRFPGTVVSVDGSDASIRLKVVMSASPQFVFHCHLTARDRLIPGKTLSVGSPVEIYLAPDALSLFPERVQ